ncbi:hypothetical protein OS493_015585 [Desmophyllum pertusum]|uniref:SWIM-type domain-containing protein n=1 Tax=Desmophyllum pertusum TaxID=174260 RepID=A0A9W9YS08_9CNID|nr:hypothetical protein OS493_015585 [Desmophyllum pertusum]
MKEILEENVEDCVEINSKENNAEDGQSLSDGDSEEAYDPAKDEDRGDSSSEEEEETAAKRPSSSKSLPPTKTRPASLSGPPGPSNPNTKKTKSPAALARSPSASPRAAASKSPPGPAKRDHHKKTRCPVAHCSFNGNDLRQHLQVHIAKRELSEESVEKLLTVVRAGQLQRGKTQLVLDLISEKVSSYPCDSPTRDSLLKLQIPGEFRAVYRVSDRSYVISATNTVGFYHIKVKSSQQITTYNCGCKGFVSKRKQEKSHTICCHLHVLFCTLELSSTGGSKAGAENVDLSTTSESPSSSTAPSVTSSLIQASSSRVFTMELYSLFKLPYKLGHQLLRLINTKDALTYLAQTRVGPLHLRW